MKSTGEATGFQTLEFGENQESKSSMHLDYTVGSNQDRLSGKTQGVMAETQRPEVRCRDKYGPNVKPVGQKLRKTLPRTQYFWTQKWQRPSNSGTHNGRGSLGRMAQELESGNFLEARSPIIMNKSLRFKCAHFQTPCLMNNL